MIIALAHNVPDAYKEIRDAIIYASPLTSIFASYYTLVLWRVLRDWQTGKDLDAKIVTAERLLQSSMNSPHATQRHKDLMNRRIEYLRELRMQLLTDGADAVVARLRSFEVHFNEMPAASNPSTREKSEPLAQQEEQA